MTKRIATKKKTLINQIIICLDRSASKASVHNDARMAYNAWIERIKKEATKTKQATTVSLVEFGVGAEVIFSGHSCGQLVERTVFHPADGSTALFDGLNLAIKTLQEQPIKTTQNESYLLICITDGQENSSSTPPMIVSKAMTELQKTDKWTFAFLLPPGAKAYFCDSYSIPDGNVQEWEATTAGVAYASMSTCQGISSYYTSRSAGKMSMSNFYGQPQLPIDTPKTASEIQRQLKNK